MARDNVRVVIWTKITYIVHNSQILFNKKKPLCNIPIAVTQALPKDAVTGMKIKTYKLVQVLRNASAAVDN